MTLGRAMFSSLMCFMVLNALMGGSYWRDYCVRGIRQRQCAEHAASHHA